MNPQTQLSAYSCLLDGVFRLAEAYGIHAGWMEAYAEVRQNLQWLVDAANTISGAAPNSAPSPLQPIFTHLNGYHPGMSVPMEKQSSVLCLPQNANAIHEEKLRELLEGFSAECEKISFALSQITALLQLMETWTSSIPSRNPDISLYDQAKITGAIGSCISEYLLDRGQDDCKEVLVDQWKHFAETPAFLLYSADFSGIQKFICTVTTKNALRALRSRSFFLELTMEHYIDELLEGCGVSRTNLLYSGGGHCYILLPNTDAVKLFIANWNTRFNDWLTEQFGISLYLADGWTECCANDLMNFPAEGRPYQAMFRRVSSAIAGRKLRRYSAGQILRLNQAETDLTGRECRICGRTSHLVKDAEGETYGCPWCSKFEQLSWKLLNKEVFLVSNTKSASADFYLPARTGNVGIFLTDKETARVRLQDNEPLVRIYTKNMSDATLGNSTRLYMGDYAAEGSMDALAEASTGISRLGVCRMDVDNLGQSFVSGFEQTDETSPSEKEKYVHIARTSAFSRHLSRFFKHDINSILDGSFQNKVPLKVTIVYSGGDDVFLVGAWTDVIEAAQRIHTALQEFSCGSLTISGGIGLFDPHFPIRQAANQTAEMEDASKSLPGKNGITLFDAGGEHTYSWEVFDTQVMGQKLDLLRRFFQDDTENERGTSFLYSLTELLRGASVDRSGKKPIQLARFAYLLSRLEPKPSAPNWQIYNEFSKKMYQSALSPLDRQQLITAIYVYTYQARKRR